MEWAASKNGETCWRRLLIKLLRDESHSEKVGSSDATSNALQNTEKEQWRNPPQYWETQDKICLCCWCRRNTRPRLISGTIFHLLNISHFSSLRCTKNFNLIRCITMAKRIQEQKEEETVVSKSRPAVMNISSYLMPPSSCAASSPIASKSPVTSGASGRLGSRMNIAACSFDAASASQVQIMDTEYTPQRAWRAIQSSLKSWTAQDVWVVASLCA